MPLIDHYTAKILIENNADRVRLIWLEPWGEDYTLLPGETLEFVARDASEVPYFHIQEHKDYLVVYIEGGTSDDYDVIQEGTRIYCGHQRQAALDAGLKI